MIVLVVGASGHLGGEVARLASAASCTVVGTSSRELDIRDRAAVLAFVAAVRPQLVINAAYRASEWRTCADGAAHVALAASSCGARLVHISSDALHAGRAEPYPDDEDPTPIYPYGAAKAAAETAVRAISPSAALIRTSLIIGDARSKQVAFALALARGEQPGFLLTDEIRRPIDATDLAAATLELAATDWSGPINIAGPDDLSRADLGRAIAHAYALNPAAIETRTLAQAALGPRPTELRLDSTVATTLLTTPIRPIAEALAASATRI